MVRHSHSSPSDPPIRLVRSFLFFNSVICREIFFDEAQLTILLCIMLLISYLRNLCLIQVHKGFTFFPRSFIVSDFTFRSMIHLRRKV